MCVYVCLCVQALIKSATMMNADSRRAPSTTYKLKILVSFAQIAMTLSEHGEIRKEWFF